MTQDDVLFGYRLQLFDLAGAWREVPESTALIIQRGPDEQREFQPRPPGAAAS